jgi:Flp pilus assembly protein TadD
MSLRRARAWVLFVAVAAYVNSVANGFAYDDNSVVLGNPVVTEGRWGDALLAPYWAEAGHEGTLYRPVTVGAFTAEWRLWHGSPLGYHAVNVLVHALVSALVLALLARFVPMPAALAGAVWFAVHPVHVEAVANVVGLAELLAAAAVLGACLLYLQGAGTPGRRAARLGALSVLYLVGLGAKEIAVTLPGVLLLLEVCRRDRASPLSVRLRREALVYLSLTAVLAAYLVLRASVLGTITGEIPSPALQGLTTGERILTALTVWPEYLRLMVFPRTLSADYAPGVLMTARGVSATVVAGAVVVLAWVGSAFAARRAAPTVAAGLGWFAITILPVSNLLFPAGILLAERTLYLPSVGVALAVGGLAEAVRRRAPPRTLRGTAALGLVAGVALFVRTVERNPAWMSTFVVLSTLADEHPESFLALRTRASGLAHVGEFDQAARYFDLAAELVPRHYGVLTEAADFFARRRSDERAEELVRQAIAVAPDQPTAYRIFAGMRIRQGRGREGHHIALEGLARAGPDRELWALVSESYIAKGDLEAAVRARRAALGQDSTSVHDWNRLAELLEALGRAEAAEAARAHMRALEPKPPVTGAGTASNPSGGAA